MTGLTAYQLGQQDARDGMMCVPEAYYCNRCQRKQYAEGYQSIRPSVSAAQILGLPFVAAYPTLREVAA